jgi:hypothetical protein
MAPRGLSRRAASAGVALVALVVSWNGVAAQGGTAAPFRSACDLIGADAVSTIVGDTLTQDEAPASIGCTFSQGGTQQVIVQLIGDQTLPLIRLTFPATSYTTVGDRTALVTPGDAKTPPSTVVALDDGLLVVQVTTDAPGDQQAASTSIAQAIIDGGPVLAQPPATTGLTPLTFQGDLCELVTAQDLRQAMGSKFTVLLHDATQCTYQGTGRSQELVSVSMLPLPLNMMRTKATTDVTVADRPALLIPKEGALLVDLGGGQVLQLVVSASPTPKGAAAKKLAKQAEQVAAAAVGRMTPATASASPTTATVCSLLSADALSSATGIEFSHVAPLGDMGCDYTSTDQRTGVLVSLNAADSLDAAWSSAGQSFGLPATPTHTTVEGLPAYDALIGTDAAAVAVDLTGTPAGDGQVLGLLLLADPAAPGDPLASALSLADLAVKAHTGA